jgi:molybdate transport system substrate-binding protein
MIRYIFLFFLLNCTSFRVEAQVKIKVAAASSLQFVMEKIKESFYREKGIEMEIILGSSGKLSAQIIQGAPYDVFVSADTKYPEALIKSGSAFGSAKKYAKGSLVIWTLNDAINLEENLKFLMEKRVVKIAMANPKTAPYGEAAIQSLEYYKVYKAVVSKMVYGDNIAQTNQYIVSKATDVGFTSKSTVMATTLVGKGKWIELDKASYAPIEQSAVVLNYGMLYHAKESEEFIKYLLSDEAKKIFTQFGYYLP